MSLVMMFAVFSTIGKHDFVRLRSMVNELFSTVSRSYRLRLQTTERFRTNSINMYRSTTLEMSKKGKDLDVNEVFENLLFAEESAQASGYVEGYEIGRNQLANGYHLGYHRASALAAQLGYYSGILEQYLGANKTNSTKAVRVAQEILQDIRNFPRCNDDSLDILRIVDEVKLKYAKFCSLAKINPSYPEADKLDF